MTTDSQHRGRRSTMPLANDDHPVQHRLERYSPGFMIGAAIGLLGVAEIADRAAGQEDGGTILLTTLTSVGFLAILAAAAAGAIACAESPRRHVFHAGAITLCGLIQAAVGVLLAFAAARQGLFAHLTTNFAIGAADVADLVLILAVMVCLAASCVALFDAADARHRERRWDDDLPRC